MDVFCLISTSLGIWDLGYQGYEFEARVEICWAASEIKDRDGECPEVTLTRSPAPTWSWHQVKTQTLNTLATWRIPLGTLEIE
jgi:hypothetical protein